MESAKIAHDCPVACATCRLAGDKLDYPTAAELCAARRLVLTVHNPEPRARVFGFKEIYSPWIRRPGSISEVLDAVGFMRYLFPRMKVVFHWRENLTRVASSDFWRLERQRNESAAHFGRVIEAYRAYIGHHADHATSTTLEGVTGRKRFLLSCMKAGENASCRHAHREASQLDSLFAFLGENVTGTLRATARENLLLADWAEEKHTRRIPVRLPNGTVVYKLQSFAWATSSQKLS